MVSRPNRIRPILLAAGAVLACSALLFFGTGLHPVWWLTWLAPLPVLLIAGRMDRPQAFGTAALSFFMGSLNMWDYFRKLLGVPVAPVLAFLLIPSCVFGLVVLAHRHFIRRGSLWKASLSVPVLWVTYEFLTSVLSPHGTFGNLAYTQMDCLPLLQIASVTGIWGIGFCLSLLPATVAAIVGGCGSRAQRAGMSAVIGSIFVLVLLYGSWRLHTIPAEEHRVVVVLMSSDARTNLFPTSDAAAMKLMGEYSDQVRRASAENAGGDWIFVLPEKIGAVSEEATVRVDSLFRETALHAKSTVIVGLDRGTTARRFNEARVYSPQGALRAIYDKQHLIPGFEDAVQPGTQRTILRESTTVWGVQICKDMDFPQLSRQYGNDGVGLLLVPAWDFGADGWLHGRMAMMRGVESGFTIARAAKQGLLTVSDDRGRVRAERNSAAPPFAVLVANAPVSHAGTLYARWGDWFAWLNMAVLVALLSIRSGAARKQTTRSRGVPYPTASRENVT